MNKKRTQDILETYMSSDERRIIKYLDKMTDEDVFLYLRKKAVQLGRPPKRSDFVELDGKLKMRFGPWPRLLEAAGLKPVSERRLEKEGSSRRKRKKARINHMKKKEKAEREVAQKELLVTADDI